MGLFEQGSFLLDNGAEIIFLECIPDGLRCHRFRESVVNEFGGFHSIIKAPSADLPDK